MDGELVHKSKWKGRIVVFDCLGPFVHIPSALVLAVALAWGGGPMAPVFRTLYTVTPSKSLFLEYVRLGLNLANQPFAIKETPHFLGERFNLTANRKELKALLNFAYSDRDFPLHGLNEQGRAKLISLIIQELDDTTDSARIRKSLIMVENCRVRYDGALYKPYVAGIPPARNRAINEVPRPRPFTTDEITAIRTALKSWWSDGTRWPHNRDEDPLETIRFEIKQPG